MEQNSVHTYKKKIVLCISYDGTHFEGFQIQNKSRTVQGELEKKISAWYGVPIRIYAAGRTDSGVHAIRQYVHFEIDKHTYDTKKIPADKISFILNSFLSKDVHIEYSALVPIDFHARYGAVTRSYCYFMYNTDVVPLPLSCGTIAVPVDIDWNLFLKYARQFLGTHNFAHFSVGALEIHKAGKSTVRTITDVSLVVEYFGAKFFIEGSGFLRRMVRSIVGHIFFRIKKETKGVVLPSIKQMLESTEHKLMGKMYKINIAKPQGLYLYDVQYKQSYGLNHTQIPQSNI